MSIDCSRCKVKRKVGVTDPLISDLSNYKTCLSCRNKLKEYRRVHVKKKKKNERDKKNSSDDQVAVAIFPREITSKQLKMKKKYVEMTRLLDKVYSDAKTQDLAIDEIVRIEPFTLPKVLAGSTLASRNIEESKTDIISVLEGEATNISDDDELIAREETEDDIPDSSTTYLLSKQINKDETLKASLIESFEIHYADRLRHVLRLCEYDFKFYVSSWKNGKYYVSFRCSEDKSALKRFGAGFKLDLGGVNEEADNLPGTEARAESGKGTSLLKSRLLDWIEPTEIEPEELNLKIENEPVNSRFHSSFGYFCESRLNFIVDYFKLVFRIRFTHKHHRLDLKYLEQNKKESKKKKILRAEEKNDPAKKIELGEAVQMMKSDDEKQEVEEAERANTISKGIGIKLSERLDELHKTLEL